MARTPKVAVIVKDEVTSAKSEHDALIHAAFTCGQSMAGQDGALVALIKPNHTNAPLMMELRTAFYEGYISIALNVDAAQARKILDLKVYPAMRPDRATDEHRTQAQERAYGRARTAWSRALGFVVTREKPAKASKGAKARVTDKPAQASAPQASAPALPIASVRIEHARSVMELIALFDTFGNAIQRTYKTNAKLTTSNDEEREAFAEWRDWLAQMPRTRIGK